MSDIESSFKPRIDSITLLENDLSPEVQEGIELVLQDLPSIADDLPKEVLENELLKLREIHYKAARMKAEGRSYEYIAKQLKVSTYTARKFVERVLHLHYNLYPREAELLTQQVLEELDLMTSHLYAAAKRLGQIYDNEVYLNEEQVKTNLAVIDRKVKILNIEPPKRVRLELSDEVLKTQQKLQQRLDSYNAIDVTPKKADDK